MTIILACFSCILHAEEFILYFTWPLPVTLLRVHSTVIRMFAVQCNETIAYGVEQFRWGHLAFSSKYVILWVKQILTYWEILGK